MLWGYHLRSRPHEFVNQELYQLIGTEHRVTLAYHPQTNGLTEQFNQTLQTALLKVVDDTQMDWDEHLPAVLFAYHTSQQKPLDSLLLKWCFADKYTIYSK